MQQWKQITEDRYNEMLDVLPPVYIRKLHGFEVKGAFACSEPYTHRYYKDEKLNKVVCVVVCSVFWRDNDGNYYEELCELYKADGTPINDTYYHCYTRGNIAIAWEEKENG